LVAHCVNLVLLLFKYSSLVVRGSSINSTKSSLSKTEFMRITKAASAETARGEERERERKREREREREKERERECV
jgi:hypothetical protein